MFVIVLNFMALGQTIYTSNVLQKNVGAQGNLLGQSSPVLELMHSNARSINLPNFVPL